MDNVPGDVGATYDTRVSLSVINVSFVQNTAAIGEDRVGGEGGAIFYRSKVKHDQILISNTSFLKNKADLQGGAVSSRSQIIVKDSYFTANSAVDSGGAIYSASINLTKCHFQFNFAQSGGALFSNGPQIVVSHTNFTNNLASAGGAISGGENVRLSCSFCYFNDNTVLPR